MQLPKSIIRIGAEGFSCTLLSNVLSESGVSFFGVYKRLRAIFRRFSIINFGGLVLGVRIYNNNNFIWSIKTWKYIMHSEGPQLKHHIHNTIKQINGCP